MDQFESAMDILKLMKQIKMSLHEIMVKEMEDPSITGPQGMIIGLLIHEGPLRMSDLADKMGLSPSTVSELVDRMEKSGTVCRKKLQADKRVVLVALTDTFQKDSQVKFKKVESAWTDRIQKATVEEREKIKEGLSVLERLLTKGDKHD
ncbi:MarR family winged helix-turn-helix transcriptional regulator [Fusibacter tunisiensis]|uniref:DNA-binding MarR family transcriptional regulator n=1 Tax=Fusibacter tunisiensis TaxID=1008308 RepID=A0ABS2MRT9_9FIRM|nr:MarR family transcriptional regulator [Fusibacter tunisiensis]MBM7562085.1 DNA-binding MarR family transcriptional regulator [Fusibacter tunisiensis]